MKIAKKILLSLTMGLAVLPAQVFAHGTNAEHQKEMIMNTYVLIGTGILFVLFLAFNYVVKNKANALGNAKKQEDREKRQQLMKTAKQLKWAWILSFVGVLISGGMAVMGSSGNTAVTIEDIHGLGYSNDGKQIIIPSHYGLRVYSDQAWSIPEGDKHDFMGFSMVDNGFYSSGHPEKGSDWVNPFGIIKSTDVGKTIETLDLKGEVDFHDMAASFKTHTIYVLNSMPNSKMESQGLYYTIDEAKTWVQSKAVGLKDMPSAMAVHPTEDAVIALGSPTGVYLSKDYGNSFEQIVSDLQATSLHFNTEGQLFVGAYKNEPSLLRVQVESSKVEKISIPSLKEDAIAYIAQNPVKENELVFATFNKDIYLSNDKGSNWTKIVDQGKGISQQVK